VVQNLLSPAGIQINGDRPFDIRVLNDAFYDAALGRGTRGALDAYVDGWWESDRLDELTAKVVSSGLTLSVSNALSLFFTSLSARLFHRQNRNGSRPEDKHYDPKSSQANPRWFMVDIRLEFVFDELIGLPELRKCTALTDMLLLRKGSRLSVQSVRKKEFDAILKIAAKQ